MHFSIVFLKKNWIRSQIVRSIVLRKTLEKRWCGENRVLVTVWRKIDILWPKVWVTVRLYTSFVYKYFVQMYKDLVQTCIVFCPLRYCIDFEVVLPDLLFVFAGSTIYAMPRCSSAIASSCRRRPGWPTFCPRWGWNMGRMAANPCARCSHAPSYANYALTRSRKYNVIHRAARSDTSRELLCRACVRACRLIR
jgi:hypothetical protein